MLAVFTLVVGFCFNTSVFAATDVYDSSNISLNNGGITYEDHTLSDGWYHMEIDKTVVIDPVGLLTISYYTGDLTQGYDFHGSDFTDNLDLSNDIVADIYIIDGIFKIQTSRVGTFSSTYLASNFSLEFISLNEMAPDDLSVNSNILTYSSDLLDGWYRLEMVDSMINAVGFLDSMYYTGDFSTGSYFFVSDDVKNIDTSSSTEICADIYVTGGSFKISSANGFITSKSNVTNINLTLIELDTDPGFNYTELTLDVPYYDIPSLDDVKAMLTATDAEDGDLSGAIQVYDENISTFTPGDDLVLSTATYQEYLFDETSTTWSVDGDLTDYDLYYLCETNGTYLKVSQFTHSSTETVNIKLADFTTIGDYQFNTNYNSFGSLYWMVEDQTEGMSISFFDDGTLTVDYGSIDFKLISKDPITSGYYASYSVQDTMGNVSYLTVNLNLYDDYIVNITYSDALNNIDVDVINDTLTSEASTVDLNIIMNATDWNTSTVENVFENMLFTSDYVDLYLTDTYYSSIVGNYIFVVDNQIDFTSSDSHTISYYVYLISNNGGVVDHETEIGITFTLLDDFGPSFEDTPGYLSVSNEYTLELSELEAQIVTSDNFDSSETLVLTLINDGYTANKTEIGRYEVVYELEDTSGNTTYHTFVIFVRDTNPPIYAFPETFTVGVYENTPITEGDLETELVTYGIIVTELGFTIDVIETEYFDNSNIPGRYPMRLLVNYDDGSSEELNLTMVVQPEDNTSSIGSINPGLNETSTYLWYPIIAFGALAVFVTTKKIKERRNLK